MRDEGERSLAVGGLLRATVEREVALCIHGGAREDPAAGDGRCQRGGEERAAVPAVAVRVVQLERARARRRLEVGEWSEGLATWLGLGLGFGLRLGFRLGLGLGLGLGPKVRVRVRSEGLATSSHARHHG